MKKTFLAVALLCAVSLSSCYTLEYSVGNGAQKNIPVKGRNHYLIGGLVPLKTTTPADLAGNEKDYKVEITHSFIDGLISAITGGFYTPTTITVTK